MLRIAVVEDEETYLRQIGGFLRQYGKEYDLEFQITEFRDGGEIAEDYRGEFDIILLDIEMPHMNGMEAAAAIRRQDNDVVLVFITSMAQYAIDGYSVGALDFILKPVNYTTFSMKLSRAIDRARARESGPVLLTTADGVVRLEAREIYYVEVQSRMLYYHTERGEYRVRGTMQGAEKDLGPSHFVRCNYWYLVNLRHVSEVRENVAVVAGEELDISRRNRTAFLHALTDYVGGNS